MKRLTAREEEIMGYFWTKGPLFVKQLLEFYDEPRPHFNTLSTIVRGLEEKGFLAHHTFGNTYQYYAAVTEADYSRSTLKNVIAKYFNNSYLGVISSLVKEEEISVEELKEQITATIEIREVFNITKVGLVAGAMVKTGKVKRSDKARLIRDGIVIFTGNINALKRFKDDVKEVGTNFECGISLVNCNDMKVGDMIETFEEIEVKQTL